MKILECKGCGHIEFDEAPEKCKVCGAAKSAFVENPAAIQKPAPSGEMFAYDIRYAGLDLLARLRIREGMLMCVDIMDEFRWGRKLNRCVEPLSRYGGAAREIVPRLRMTRQMLVAKNKNWEKNEDQRKDIYSIDKLIAQVEADKNPPQLQGMADFIKRPAIPAAGKK